MDDIRRFMTSPRNHRPSPLAPVLPAAARRNRRIHDTDSSSGEEIPYVRRTAQAAQIAPSPQPHDPAPLDPVQPQPLASDNVPVDIASSTDESDNANAADTTNDDEIFVLRPQAAQSQPARTPVPAPMSPNAMSRSRNVTVNHARGQQATPRPRAEVTQSRRQRSRFETEADEDNDAASDCDVADESDEDAAALYRSTIMSLRNRPNALRQVRLNTMPCAVCRRFATYLQFFVNS